MYMYKYVYTHSCYIHNIKLWSCCMYMFTLLLGIVHSQLMHILVTTGTPATIGTPASDELSAGVYGGIAAGAAALLVLLVVLLFCACGTYI